MKSVAMLGLRVEAIATTSKLAARARRLCQFSAIILLGMVPTTARAEFVVSGQSQGYGVSTDLTLVLLDSTVVQATVLPTPLAQGMAPPPYNNSASLASLAVSQGAFVVPTGTGTLLDLNTGILQATATSNVDGLAGSRMAAATSIVNGLDLGVVVTSLIPALPVVTDAQATTIETMAMVSGDFGSLLASGSTRVENLMISVLGQVVFNATGSVDVAPNTVVDVSSVLGGVSIILNEQIFSGDTVSQRSVLVNGIHIRYTDVSVTGVGTLNGDVIIAHSEASLSAIPEPSAIALVTLGGCFLGFAGCRRSRRRGV